MSFVYIESRFPQVGYICTACMHGIQQWSRNYAARIRKKRSTTKHRITMNTDF